MPVDFEHPQYVENVSDWKSVRDCVKGGRAVTSPENQTRYLPMPPGMKDEPEFDTDLTESPSDMVTGLTRYRYYASFAEFPENVAPALNGTQGLIHVKPPTVEGLEGKLSYLTETATPGGMPLISLWHAMTYEILQTGRVSLLAEVSRRKEDRIYLCPYVAESLTNWRQDDPIDGAAITLAVLREHVLVDKDDDAFELMQRIRWRELRLENSKYVVRLWEAKDEGATPVQIPVDNDRTEVSPGLTGGGFKEVPLTVVNVNDIGFGFGPIPFLPMSKISLRSYRISADYYRSLHIKGDPQPYLFGVEEAQIPDKWGGDEVWGFSNENGSAGMLDIDGNGIPMQREELERLQKMFDLETASLRTGGNDNGAPESGEALRRRHSAQQVSLQALVINAAEGLQTALRQIARLFNLSETQAKAITVTPSLDFTEPTMSAAEYEGWIRAKQMGGRISWETIHRMMMRGRIPVKDFEEEGDDIDEEPPEPELVGVDDKVDDDTEEGSEE